MPVSTLERLLAPNKGMSMSGYVNFIVRQIMENKNDMVASIVGYEGYGKSLLGRHLARAFAHKTGTTFSVKPMDPEGEGGNIQYPGQCFTASEAGIRYLPRGSPFLSDEAIASLFSRTSMRNEQMALVQFLAMMRKRGLFSLFISPDRRWNDVFVRGHRALYLFHTRQEFVRDPLGRLHGRKGIADFYYREDMGNASPFSKFAWWQKAGTLPFPGPEDDPDNDEYEYWSNIHKDAFAAGFEAPWKDFPYEKGRVAPSVDDMRSVVQSGDSKTFCYRFGEVPLTTSRDKSFMRVKKDRKPDDDGFTT